MNLNPTIPMNNGIFTTSWKAVGESILVAVVLAMIGFVASIILSAGFSVWTADWVTIAKQMVDVGVIAFATNLMKDVLSTYKGSFLDIGPNQTS